MQRYTITYRTLHQTAHRATTATIASEALPCLKFTSAPCHSRSEAVLQLLAENRWPVSVLSVECHGTLAETA